MTDDILLHGKTEEDHQRTLLAVLERLEERGVTLNLEKCQFYKKEGVFYGLRFSAEGVAPTEDRVKALREAKAPTNAKELHSFLCTILWSARFMKDVSTIAEPLWKLTKKDVPWNWAEVEQTAYDRLKDLITTKYMSYYRKDWETELITDASPVGLGGVLCQYNPANHEERHIICFLSRLLTDVERRYSQCEKEALAVVWACERAQIYLLGHHFTVVTDNRAVSLIYSNTKSRPPARIERWALRLTQFDFSIVHRPGNTNIADYYSRSPCKAGVSAYLEEIASERHIAYIVRSAIPPAVTVEEVAEATNDDPELKELRTLLAKGAKHLPNTLKRFESMLSEMSVTREGILLRSHQIVVPKSLRARIVDLAHRGHQGIVKTKRLIRSRVWFEGIDSAVEQKVKLCKECQANSDRPSYEPLKPSKMPETPWYQVAGDFYGPMDDGMYWFVNICEHSQKAFVDKIRRTDEEETEKVLDRIFNVLGAPVIYKTDNGSPFQSHAFREYAKKWGFKHRRVTPEWPRANGKAESFMKKLGKVLRTSKISGQDKNEALNEFLRAYSETPHSSTGIPPNHLIFGFSRTSGIPYLGPETLEQRERWRQTALANDAKAKKRMEAEYNQRMRAREPTITLGSKVVIQLKKKCKSDSGWDIERPFEVIAIKGSMITAKRHDHTTTRNSSCFKLYRYESNENEPIAMEAMPQLPQRSILKKREEAAPVQTSRTNEDPPSNEATQSDTELPSNEATQPDPELPSNEATQPDPEPPSNDVAQQETSARPQRTKGRPTKEASREIQRQRRIAKEAKTVAFPPARVSERVRNQLLRNRSPSKQSPSNQSPSDKKRPPR